MEYLLKASAISIIFFICYKIWLQNETFFKTNRWFLCIGIICTFSIPLVSITDYVTQPNYQFEIPVNQIKKSTSETETYALNLNNILLTTYVVGVILLSLKFLINVLLLSKVFFSSTPREIEGIKHISTSKKISPFSFFNWIVYNPNQFSKTELENIINHERAHVKGFHSFDHLVSQLTTILLWFNPFIWLYHKDVLKNLEFIADDYAQKKATCHQTYQTLILKTTVPDYQLVLANNFYTSLIKKRIIMLHKSKSNQFKQLKLILVLPFLALFIMSFNTNTVYVTPHDIDSNPNENFNTLSSAVKKNSKDIEILIIDNEFTDAQLNKIMNDAKAHNIDLKFKNVKRNSKNEIIAIKINMESEHSSTSFSTSSTEPISPIKLTYGHDGKNLSIGGAKMLHKEGFTWSTNNSEHAVTIDTSGENTFIIKSGDANDEHKVQVANNVYVIKKDKDSNKKHIVVESGNGNKEIIVIENKDGSFKEEIIIHKDQNTWVSDENEVIVHKNKGNNMVFLSTDGESPLVYVDGKKVSREYLENLNPNKIESIEILKGESATKAYGKAAKNGVVLVKTKS